jgi:hypothetical protein
LADNTKSASESGIEQTRADFLALTGVYPEDAQSGEIDSISDISIVPREDWWRLYDYDKDGGFDSSSEWKDWIDTDNTDDNTNGKKGIKQNGNQVSLLLKVDE